MSDQTLTPEQLDARVHAAANKTKADLNQGVALGGAPKGDELRPTRHDPLGNRKAMFKKADEIRAAESGIAADPAAQAEIDAMVARANVDETGQTPANVRQMVKEQQRRDAAAEVVANAPAAQPRVEERVRLKLGEREITVTRADIESAGGEAMYLRRREMDEEALALAQAQERTRQLNEDLTRRLAEASAVSRSNRTDDGSDPGQGRDPASIADDPSATVRPGTRGVDIAAQAREIAAGIYSGDQDDAAKAVEKMLRMGAARGETLSVDDIVAKVTAQLRGQDPTPRPAQPPAAEVNPVVRTVNEQIDNMARREFPDLLKDEFNTKTAFEKFKQLVRLPENADRRAVDVAREACQWVVDKLENPRADVIERKRTLPVQPTATSGVPEFTDDDVPANAAGAVAMIQASRQFGRRRQQ